jgi:hypothetical protein
VILRRREGKKLRVSAGSVIVEDLWISRNLLIFSALQRFLFVDKPLQASTGKGSQLTDISPLLVPRLAFLLSNSEMASTGWKDSDDAFPVLHASCTSASTLSILLRN